MTHKNTVIIKYTIFEIVVPIDKPKSIYKTTINVMFID